MMADPDAAMDVPMGMEKLDLGVLPRAYTGEDA
jgi:hypothetical protein